ncbi:Uncharacterised protein [Mycobacteroides abscessus subsp. abscessus]|nr:Uncharacterised protein [Mycobacteroides abscessus subsp. abscessus]
MLVQLAIHGHRQRLQRHHGNRNHVSRELLGQCGTSTDRICASGDVADDPLVAGTVFADDHRRLPYPVQSHECGLNLAEFDPISADLDLLVGPPQILQLPVGAP